MPMQRPAHSNQSERIAKIGIFTPYVENALLDLLDTRMSVNSRALGAE
jgi:hypothetical protein